MAAHDAEFAPVLRDGLPREETGCGVAIGVLDHGQRRVFTCGAARADSIFETGSVTKTFTGLALAQLAAQKKVSLDEPVRALIPFDVASSIAPGSSSIEITLLDRVTHRSGLPSVPDNLRVNDAECEDATEKGILEFGPSPALKRGLSLTGRGKNLTPNPLPRGKGDQIRRAES